MTATAAAAIRPRRSRARWAWVGGGLALVLVTMLLFLGRPDVEVPPPLSPTSEWPDGTKGLVLLLEAVGADVTVTDHQLKTRRYAHITDSAADGSATWTTAWGQSIHIPPRRYLTGSDPEPPDPAAAPPTPPTPPDPDEIPPF